MRENDLVDRTKKFAIDCWHLCDKLPNSRGFNAYANQLIRCSSSVGANYRASQRAKSSKDFINKLKIDEEEIDESVYFLELLMAISTSFNQEIYKLNKEAKELLAMIVTSIITSKAKL